MKARLVLLLTGVGMLLPAAIVAADEGPVVIRNKFLEVRVDRKAGEITILAKGKLVVLNGHVGPYEKGAKVTVSDAIMLPRTDAIEVANLDGRIDRVMLFDDEPFAYVTGKIRNEGTKPMLVSRVPIFNANISSSDALENLKVLGTGGLRNVDEKVGSYMWVAAQSLRVEMASLQVSATIAAAV